MGLFGNMFSSTPNVVRCDQAEYLIWKYPGGVVKKGTSVNVTDGEVAVLIGSTQKCVEGPCNQVTDENLSEVYFINLAGSNVVRFAVPYFSVIEPKFPNLPVPVAVRGSINFSISDYRAFMRMHRLVGFDIDGLQKKIKDAVVKYVKSVVTNIPSDYGIPLVQMEKKILEIGDILDQYLKQRLDADFAVFCRSVDLNAVEYDSEDSNYKELRSLTQDEDAKDSRMVRQDNRDAFREQANLRKTQNELDIDRMKTLHNLDMKDKAMNMQMDRELRSQDILDRGEKLRIQRELGERTGNAQIDEMQKSGRMAMGGIGGSGRIMPSGINRISSPSETPRIEQTQPMGGNGLNMGPATPPQMNTSQPQMPPQMPQISIYVAIGGQQQGPFDYNMLKQMVQTGGLTAQTLVWKEGLAAWTPASQVPEVASILNTPQVPPTPSQMPPGVPPTL